MKATVWVDGSGTPTTPCACGAHVRIGEVDHYFARKLHHLRTNSEAEVTAVAFGVQKARELGATSFYVMSDSQATVNWLNGYFKCSKPHLFPMVNELKQQLEMLDAKIVWKPRENSVVPDCLCHMIHNSPFETLTISPVPVDFSLPKNMRNKRSRCYLEAVEEKLSRFSPSS